MNGSFGEFGGIRRIEAPPNGYRCRVNAEIQFGGSRGSLNRRLISRRLIDLPTAGTVTGSFGGFRRLNWTASGDAPVSGSRHASAARDDASQVRTHGLALNPPPHVHAPGPGRARTPGALAEPRCPTPRRDPDSGQAAGQPARDRRPCTTSSGPAMCQRPCPRVSAAMLCREPFRAANGSPIRLSSSAIDSNSWRIAPRHPRTNTAGRGIGAVAAAETPNICETKYD